MRFLRRSLVGLFLLSVTLGVLVLAGKAGFDALQTRWAKESPQRPARERVFAVNVVEFSPETISPNLSVFGEIRSRRTLEVRATAGGRLVWLAEEFEEGGQVAEGDLLARIDQADAEAALRVAGTDLQEAEAELAEAERAVILSQDDLAGAEEQSALRDQALARSRDAKARGVSTDTAVEQAELASASARQAVVSRRQALAQAMARVDQARTRLDRQEIMLEENRRALAETEIFAAFSGTLSAVNVVQGRLVSNNERLAELIDSEALEVSFRLSSGEYARLLDADGLLLPAAVAVSLDIDGIDLVATGTINRESAAVGAGQTGRLIFARLDATRGFRPGDFVSVTIAEVPLENVALLPASAIGSDQTVLILGADDRLESAPVTVIRRQGDAVIVQAADLAGREIVAERTPLLGAGIRVRPLRPGDSTEAASAAPTVPPIEPDMVELTAERRAKLVAFVEGNSFMPEDAKKRVLAQLQEEKVPAQMIERIESRMGG